MKKEYIELTCKEASALLPVLNSVITFYENVYETRLEELDINHMAFLKESIKLLHDAVALDLDVILEVNITLSEVLENIYLMTVMASTLLMPKNDPYFEIYVKLKNVIKSLGGM